VASYLTTDDTALPIEPPYDSSFRFRKPSAPMKVYLASPLGFSEGGIAFLKHDLLPLLTGLGLEVTDPWEGTRDRPWAEIKAMFGALSSEDNAGLARLNAEAIERVDWVVAVLDGTDIDSGTAGEIGFAYANGKRIIGYLGDVRVSKDNASAEVNLQIEWFIRASGGTIAQSLADLERILREYLAQKGLAAHPMVRSRRKLG
jgi:nucleoside 2-deoxyribosyltransferase